MPAPVWQPQAPSPGPKSPIPLITVQPSVPRKGSSTSKAPAPVLKRDFDDPDNYCCCSWTRMCEVLGNRQGKFITTLRPLRGPLVFALQSLKRFELELERNIKSKESAEDTSLKVLNVVNAINGLTTHIRLNIPPEENQMLRAVANELVILQRVIDEVAITLRRNNQQRMRSDSKASTAPTGMVETPVASPRSIRPSHATEGGHYPQNGTAVVMPPVPPGRPDSPTTYTTLPVLQFTNPEVDANLVTTVTRTYDEHSLKERIARNCDRIEQLIRFVDQKCARRWWLKDLISFFQLFIKLALFVSASVSVVYHKEILPSIVTLVIAVLQGVIELLDQFFVKNIKPEEVKISTFIGGMHTTSGK